MPRQEYTDALAHATTLMAGGKSEHGVQAFDLIENSAVLTPQEKQEAFQSLVKAGVTENMNGVVDGATLLRGNNATTGLMTSFMDKYASEYNANFQDVALKEAAKVKLPSSLNKVQHFGPIGSHLTDTDGNAIPQKDVDAFHQASTDLAGKMLQASQSSLDKLTPEARAFIQAAMEPTHGNDAAKNMVAANTLFLRGANAQFSETSGAIRATSNYKAEGAMMFNANIIMQTYVNAVNNPVNQVGPKPQDQYAAQLRTQGNLDRTKEAFSALSSGGQTLTSFQQKTGTYDVSVSRGELEKSNVFAAKGARGGVQATQKGLKDEAANLESNIVEGLDQLTKQQQTLDRMRNNPSMLDKFKAVFQGGMDKACQKMEGKINNTINGIADTINTHNAKPENKSKIDLDKIISKHENRIKSLKEVGDRLVESGGLDYVMNKTAKMDVSGMGAEKQMYKEYQKVEGRIEKVENRKEAVESVREAMAKNAPKHGTTPQVGQGHGHGMH